MACRLLGEVTLYGQFDQIFSLGCVAAVVPSVPADQRRELTRAWIQQGRITVWREIPSNGDQPVSNQILAPLYRSYATQIGMDPGTVVANAVHFTHPVPCVRTAVWKHEEMIVPAAVYRRVVALR